MKRYRLNKRILCVLMLCSLMMAVGSASAFFPQSDEVKWFSANGAPLYDASEFQAKGQSIWTIEGLHSWEPKLIKQITLDDGKVSEWQLDAGYIIQSDPAEYDGLLFAVEKTPMEIWHVSRDGTKTLLSTYSIPIPYYDSGQQTVRAYMHGDLYYFKALKDKGLSVAGGGNDDVAEVVYYPAPTEAVLCRRSESGHEYQYSLNNFETDEDGRNHRLIDGYAIQPNGNLAWITGLGQITDNPKRTICVENPNGEISVFIDETTLSKLECSYLESRCIAWLDETTILFAAHDPNHDVRLFKLAVDTGNIEELTNQQGEQIFLTHRIMAGSNVILNSDQTLLFYMGVPNRFEGWSLNNWQLEISVPIMIDLRSGTTYILYENKAKADDPNSLYEVRDNAGQLAYVETD